MNSYKPLPKQKLAYKYIAEHPEVKYILYGGAAGGGKTWLGCEWLMVSSVHHPGTRWFIGRNNLKDARESVLITWAKVAKVHGFSAYNYRDNTISLMNGSEIVFLDLTYYPQKDPMFERLGSKEFTGGWIEEAGEVNFAAFDVLKSRVGRHYNKEKDIPTKILITCNPKKNWLYKLFYRPWKNGKLDKDKAFIPALPKDNIHLTNEYIENLRSIQISSTRERLLAGNWEYDDDPAILIEYNAILDLFENSHVSPSEADRWITADIASHGSDYFRLAVWKGSVLVDHCSLPKSGGKEVVDKIKEYQKKYQVRPSRIIYDNDGIGGYIGGRGGYIPRAYSFNNGAKPLKYKGKIENYENLKTQCYYHLARKINNGELYLQSITDEKDRELIIEELEQVKSRDADKDGKIRLERKETTKQILGRSPDWADVLMMKMITELDHKRGPQML